MMMKDPTHGPFAERARRSIREISVAVALTLAALVFLIAALKGAEPETALNSPTEEVATQPN